MSNIIVIGKSGQLATEIKKYFGDKVTCLGRDDIDITDVESITSVLNGFTPSAIINASAYTAVDKAESDRENAFAINQLGVENLAKYCASHNTFLVHVSTDYVFDGVKGSPYLVDDAMAPTGVYGESKAEGDKSLLDILPNSSALIRTSWVYSSTGNNFVKTMIRLMNDKPEVKVVDDQIGTPTWAKSLALACVEAADNSLAGVYHWSDEGVTSWYDFAVAIQELGIEKGLITKKVPIHPIPSADFPTPVKRPFYSVLDKTLTRKTFEKTPLTQWRVQLSHMLDELVSQ